MLPVRTANIRSTIHTPKTILAQAQGNSCVQAKGGRHQLHPLTRRAQTLTLPARYARATSVTTATKPPNRGSAFQGRSPFERKAHVRFCHTFNGWRSISHFCRSCQSTSNTPDDMNAS